MSNQEVRLVVLPAGDVLDLQCGSVLECMQASTIMVPATLLGAGEPLATVIHVPDETPVSFGKNASDQVVAIIIALASGQRATFKRATQMMLAPGSGASRTFALLTGHA